MSRFIQRRTITINLPCENADGSRVTASVDTMQKAYEIIVTPTSRDQLNATDEAIIQDLLRKLDPQYTGQVTEIDLGGYLELSEPEYVFFKKQVDAGSLWFGTFDHHPIARQVYREWRDAPTEAPLGYAVNGRVGQTEEVLA